ALAYSNNESLPPKTIYICHCSCPFNTEVPDTMYNAIIDPYANAETTESQLYYSIGPYYYAGEFIECQSFYDVGSYAGSEITGDQYFYPYAGADNQFIYNTGPYAGSEFTADNNVNPRWQ
ncbi:5912_t:CDS:1, partial [Paraglomus occultum]